MEPELVALISPSLIKVSVRELVAFSTRGGDLHAHQFGAITALEGLRGHQRLQKERGEDYQAEVSVSYRHSVADFELEISGRMDGLFFLREPQVVEEIKTTRKPFEDILEDVQRLHLAQCRCYAAIYAFQKGLERLTLQLTYFNVDSGKTYSLREFCRRAELDLFLQEIVTAYIEEARRRSLWQAARNLSLGQLAFPFAEYRAGQRQFAVVTYRAIRDGQRLFAQAPTGIGKTVAALYPTLKALGEGRVGRIFFLTAKNSGAELAIKALAQMRGQGMLVKTVQITAKDKMCFDAPCNVTQCPYALGYYDRLRPALEALFERQTFLREEILAAAQAWQLCPFELSLDLASSADVVICDYNYAFDPGSYLRRFFGGEQSGNILLIDEAHNLVDRSREMYSAELQQGQLQALAQNLKQNNLFPEFSKAVTRISRACSRQLKLLLAEVGTGTAEKVVLEPPQPLVSSLSFFTQEIEAWLAEAGEQQLPAELREFYFQTKTFMRCMEFFDHRFATLYRWQGKKLSVRIQCLDAAHLLARTMDQLQSAVFFSATLTPFAYFQALLGANKESPCLSLASPFPTEHLCLLVASGISTRYQDRTQSQQALAELIATVVAQRNGNYLVFFPSYRYLRDTLACFEWVPPAFELLVQESGMDESSRQQFLDRFERQREGTLVGFAVMGGSFGEGIDLVGESLIGVIVVGVGLPMVCTERELMKDYFTTQGFPGFEFAYQFPGMNRVLQTAGRVIRSAQDRGVVCLIDQRFAQGRYRQLFPAHWSPQFVRTAGETQDRLRQFWQSSVNVDETST